MKLSLRWLKSMVPGLELEGEALYEHLADRGAPVEDVVQVGVGLENVVVGQVRSVRQHPNADRLSLCEVDNGEEVVQVVCGAPLIHEGGFYPFAPVGTELPGGIKLKKAKIRGEHSNGMLCSEKELELGRDQSGIMHLQAEGLKAGQPFLEAMGLDDVRIEIEVSPNRGDLLSHLGVARELTPDGVAGVELAPIPGAPDLDLTWKAGETEGAAGGITVRIQEPEMCPRFVGVVIRGVEVRPSPDWLAARLRAVGQQPINNIVDATNYVMLEMGNPMHAYDLARLEGPEVVVRYARDGEVMTTLDDVERKLTSTMVMVCDRSVPHDIGGTMGGEHSSVTEDTTDVFLEAALWVPSNIRSTRRALDISTDASYRFERGVDPLAHDLAIERALQMILATAGGEIDGAVLDLCPTPYEASVVELRTARVERVLGQAFSRDELAGLLVPLGFECVENGEDLRVTVPSFRSYDVTREIDLIEEIARIHGFNNFGEELGPSRPSSVPDHPLFQLEDRLRVRSVALGLMETTHPAFAPASEGEVEIQNPISMEESHLRTSLLPAMLRTVEYNWARGARDLRFFELGTVFRTGGPSEAPEEAPRFAIVMTGRERPAHWSRESGLTDQWTLRGAVEAVLPWVGVPDLLIDPTSDETGLFDSSTSFRVVEPDESVRGWGGRVHDARLDPPAWASPVWAVELELPAEPQPKPDVVFEPLPAFPGVDRDLALLVPDGVPAADVIEHVYTAGGELLESVSIFDIYRGEGVPDGHRSLAVRLRLQARDRTLKDKDADRVVRRVLARLTEEAGVEQRV